MTMASGDVMEKLRRKLLSKQLPAASTKDDVSKSSFMDEVQIFFGLIQELEVFSNKFRRSISKY